MESPTVVVRSEAGGVARVVCSGEFDLDSVGLLAQACDGEAAGAELLVVDVARLAFADSAFLSVLVRLRRTRQLVLEGPVPDRFRRLLEMTGVLPLFEIRDGTGSA
ncbi:MULTISPECIES: STAS domain-containing protein [unclassified Streptomyces]|uniref:STAS domain-containing protein n=1 Tax=unclassified Streptomyces TaxID=2593676 RepID=UPI0029A7D53E|nr:STAS domain-containing protein [Streptomyces sp. DK15]MDX2389517.1 STAS domain-containing protein [Streptomyces sp. DK15]